MSMPTRSLLVPVAALVFSVAAFGPPAARATGKPITATNEERAKYRSDLQGWELVVPPAWKLVERPGHIVIDSDVEPGLIVAWYAPGVTFEQLALEPAQGVSDRGV